MSKRIRRRDRSTARAARQRRSPSPDEILEQTVDTYLKTVKEQVAGLAAATDPTEAELAASDLLALWHPKDPMDREPLEILGTAVLDRLAKRTDPDTLALLIAIAATADEPFATAARESAERLRAEGVPEPLWSQRIGRPRFVHAWISTDEYEDQSNLLAAFAYDNWPPHGINLMLDANFNGLIRLGFVTSEPDRVREDWEAKTEYPIRQLDEQELADLLANGLEWFDTYLDPPVDDDGKATMPLVRSRLRLLPPPRPIEVRKVPDEDRQALLDEFIASDEAAGLSTDDHGPSAQLASWPIDFACDYGAGDPLRWSPIAVELFLLDWMPRKALIEPGEIDALPEVLRAFVRFAGRRKGLSAVAVGETIDHVGRFEAEFKEAMADDAAAGPAKQLVAEMRAAGVDFGDAEAVRQWIDARNAALVGQESAARRR